MRIVMRLGKLLDILDGVREKWARIMCHHTPCTRNCESGGMAVDLPPCGLPHSLAPRPLGVVSVNSKPPNGTSPPSSDWESCKLDSEVDADLQYWPKLLEVGDELVKLGNIAWPMVVMGILLYLRSMVSMLFLGGLGDLELAGGSLSIGFANITGYSVLAGLAMGMEAICGQAFGAKRWQLIGVTLQRMILILVCACLPIAILWINMQRILILCGQDPEILGVAHTYIMFSLPDLAAQAILNPLRIYLRTQQITKPLTYCAFLALLLHIPTNVLFVYYFGLHVKGVALAAACTDLNLVGFLIAYLWYTKRYKRTWEGWSWAAFEQWGPLLRLAIPSCVSVCLEWWWYELMIMLSGLLVDAQATVASMGILIQTTALVYIFPSALGLAVSTRVGNELGASRPGRARNAMLVALGCAFGVGILACTFTTSMRHLWGTMFTKDAKILSLTALVLPIVGLCELGNCPQTTGCGVLRGSARPSTGANINLGSFYFVGMPVALALGFWFRIGFVGLWFGLLAAQLTCVILMLTVLLRTDWIDQARRSKDLTSHSTAKVAPATSEFDAEECLVRKPATEIPATEAKEMDALISVKVVRPDMADDSA